MYYEEMSSVGRRHCVRIIGSAALFVIGGVFWGAGAAGQPIAGHFEGEVVAEFLTDGRNMRVVRAFAYIDPAGKRWDVPVGAVTDGASIPQVLWVCCPPFTGKYRAAAVVHDYYCQSQSTTWEETHQVFYHAMIASGMGVKQAKVMYAAVYNFGPRWGPGMRGEAEKKPSLPEQEAFLKDVEVWIQRDDPGLDEIGWRLESGVPLPRAP